MSLDPGTRLGPYEIVSPLGAGGMGEVYRARDTRLDRDVAIKVLPHHLSSNPEVRARFEREAKTVSGLNHPNICVLHDVGREGDTDYLVMELVEGETLAARLVKGPLPMTDAIRIGAEISDALDRAHRAGIVHRDLKPGNIMLTKSGAKLMDFGLARATGLAGPAGSGVSIGAMTQSPTVGQPLTAEGTIVGTFQYMSPEQLEGREADERSDIWSLGCVLYEMATGKRAFDGRSQATLISSIMTTEPAPVSQVAPMTPPAFDRLVRTCIAKEAGDRIQSAHDVRLQLVWIAEGGSQAGTAAPVSRKRRNRERTAWTVAVVAILVAATSGFMAWKNRAVPSRGAAHLTLSLPDDSPLTIFGNTQISPDGRSLVVTGVSSDGSLRLYLRPIDRNEMRLLEGTENGFDPFWSPDGRNIGFFADDKLKRVPAGGGPARVLCDAANSAGASWGTSGTIVFNGGESQPLFAIPEDGGTPRPVTKMEPLDEAHRWPQFLPDGKRFIYLADARRTEDHWLRVGSIDEDLDVPVLQNAITNIAFAAPDHLFFVRGGTLLEQRFDTGKLELQGEPVSVARQIYDSAPFHHYEFSASAAGVVAFRSVDPKEELVWFDREGKRLETVGKPERYSEVRLSPDGTRLAYVNQDADGRHDQLHMLDLSRGITSRPTAGAGNYSNPVWSPDGDEIAYGGSFTGNGCLYLSTISGTRRDEEVLCGSPDAWPTDWSRDGHWLVFCDVGDTTFIRARSMVDPVREVTLVTSKVPADDARFSPDGNWVAYTEFGAGMGEIYVQDFPAARHRYQVSAGGGYKPTFAPGGREILYVNDDGDIIAAGIRRESGFALDAPRKLFRVPGGELMDISRDGKRLLMKVPVQDAYKRPVQVIFDWQSEVAAGVKR